MEKEDKFKMLDNKLIWHPDILDKWRKKEFFAPIHLDIGATSNCNYKCIHCFYSYLSHKPRNLKREILLNLMEDIAKAGVRSIFFASQGEPLVNPATPEAILVASKLGIDVALSSNGSLFNHEVSEKILPDLKWVRISVLAASKETYCNLHGTSQQIWQSTFKNLENMANFKVKRNLSTILGVQTCLLPENNEEIIPLTKLFKNIGFNYITFRPISNHPKNEYHVKDDLLHKFEENLHKAEELSDDKFNVVIRWNLYDERKTYSKCLGLPFISFVNADGGIYTCGCHLDEQKYCYGNINQQRFSDIWFNQSRLSLTEESSKNPDFKNCDIICRHHAINKFLWEYSKEPAHVNFI